MYKYKQFVNTHNLYGYEFIEICLKGLVKNICI
jgi:hypothetical protein